MWSWKAADFPLCCNPVGFRKHKTHATKIATTTTTTKKTHTMEQRSLVQQVLSVGLCKRGEAPSTSLYWLIAHMLSMRVCLWHIWQIPQKRATKTAPRSLWCLETESTHARDKGASLCGVADSNSGNFLICHWVKCPAPLTVVPQLEKISWANDFILFKLLKSSQGWAGQQNGMGTSQL